ncbi:MAG: hypothetical protein IH988_10275 [Planctomycetes bacterium]|nr:hypothetical protein [Planctomycetota bacterium]
MGDTCHIIEANSPCPGSDTPTDGEVNRRLMTAGQVVDDCPGSDDRLDGVRWNPEWPILG